MAIDAASIQTGDLITFRAVTRSGARTVTRKVTGFYSHRAAGRLPTVRYHGIGDFIVHLLEISKAQRPGERFPYFVRDEFGNSHVVLRNYGRVAPVRFVCENTVVLDRELTLRSLLLTHRARTLQAVYRAQWGRVGVTPEVVANAHAYDVAAHYARQHR